MYGYIITICSFLVYQYENRTALYKCSLLTTTHGTGAGRYGIKKQFRFLIPAINYSKHEAKL